MFTERRLAAIGESNKSSGSAARRPARSQRNTGNSTPRLAVAVIAGPASPSTAPVWVERSLWHKRRQAHALMNTQVAIKAIRSFCISP